MWEVLSSAPELALLLALAVLVPRSRTMRWLLVGVVVGSGGFGLVEGGDGILRLAISLYFVGVGVHLRPDRLTPVLWSPGLSVGLPAAGFVGATSIAWLLTGSVAESLALGLLSLGAGSTRPRTASDSDDPLDGQFVRGIVLQQTFVILIVWAVLGAVAVHAGFLEVVAAAFHDLLLMGALSLIAVLVAHEPAESVGPPSTESGSDRVALGALLVGTAVLFELPLPFAGLLAGLLISDVQLRDRPVGETLKLEEIGSGAVLVALGLTFDPRLAIHHWASISAVLLVLGMIHWGWPRLQPNWRSPSIRRRLLRTHPFYSAGALALTMLDPVLPFFAPSLATETTRLLATAAVLSIILPRMAETAAQLVTDWRSTATDRASASDRRTPTAGDPSNHDESGLSTEHSDRRVVLCSDGRTARGVQQLLVDVHAPSEHITVEAASRLFEPTVHVLSLWRNDAVILEPDPTTELRLGDRLVVAPRRDQQGARRSNSPSISP